MGFWGLHSHTIDTVVQFVSRSPINRYLCNIIQVNTTFADFNIVKRKGKSMVKIYVYRDTYYTTGQQKAQYRCDRDVHNTTSVNIIINLIMKPLSK